MANDIQKAGNVTPQKQFSALITSESVVKRINETIGADKRNQFITSVLSAVNTNPDLARCEGMSIINSAMMGFSLNLLPSPQLGYFYMVPFKDNKNDREVATFILGYKGYKQLAIRSGYYKSINVLAIKEGEVVKTNPLTEEYEFNLMEDGGERENAKTVGYYGYFELLNGYKKPLYWPKSKMYEHALRYSAGFKADVKRGTNYTYWGKDFDGQACKTIIRQLFSKGDAPLSIDMQTAYDRDNEGMEKFESQYIEQQDALSDMPMSTDDLKESDTAEMKPADKMTLTPTMVSGLLKEVEREGIAKDFFEGYLMETFNYMSADEIEVSNISTVKAWIKENGKHA